MNGGEDLSSGAPMEPGNDGAAALETGRLMFAGEWGFIRACHAVADLPPIERTEIAFAGRSNVGKSTLLNALTGRKQLARSSNTPGRTRALNLFSRTDQRGPVIVDMPGYGYAKAPKKEVAAWTELVFDYLLGRPSLRRVFLLIDARHGPKENDRDAMKAMDGAAVSYQAVLTKADKAGQGLATAVEATQKALAKRPAAHPVVLATSADTMRGMPDLRATIAELLAN